MQSPPLMNLSHLRHLLSPLYLISEKALHAVFLQAQSVAAAAAAFCNNDAANGRKRTFWRGVVALPLLLLLLTSSVVVVVRSKRNASASHSHPTKP